MLKVVSCHNQKLQGDVRMFLPRNVRAKVNPVLAWPILIALADFLNQKLFNPPGFNTTREVQVILYSWQRFAAERGITIPPALVTLKDFRVTEEGDCIVSSTGGENDKIVLAHIEE